VYVAVGHKVISFMDGNAGYNHVTVHVIVTLGKYFDSVKCVFVCIKFMCVYVKLLKI
jgi:hypothetical protein